MVRSLFSPAVALLLAIALACGGGVDEPETASQQPSAGGASAGAQVTESAPETMTPKYGGTLVLRQRNDPQWDPASGFMASDEGRVYHLTYPRLFTLHKGPPACQLWPPDPELVESWDWVDERTLEIKLTPGARHSDAAPANGREITAEDVVNQYERAFELQAPTQPAKELTESVTAVDKLTVRFTLKAPFATYMEDVMGQRWNIVMPREITPDDVSMTWEDHVGQGGGPFLLKSYSQGTSIEFEKNPNYFQEGLPYLDGITEPIIPDESTVVAGLRTGKVHVSEIRGSFLIAELLQTAPELQSQSCPYPASFVLEMRTDQPPLNDKRVRQALSMGINREAMGTVAYAGHFFPKYSPVHQGFGDWALPLDQYAKEQQGVLAHDPEGAKRLLTDAGFSNGLEVLVNFSPAFPAQNALAEFLSTAWQDIGVTAKLQPLERQAWAPLHRGGEYDGTAVLFASSASIDEALYHYFKCDVPRNVRRNCDSNLDALLDQMRSEGNETARRAIVNDIQKLLAEQQYRIELPQNASAEFFQPYVHNVWYRTDAWSDGDYVKFAWMDQQP
jgi:peptide/nickel transport system substrate-binding protein